MNIKKRNAYENTMTINGIDTLSGYVPKKITHINENVQDNIDQCNIQPDQHTYLLINPNKQGKHEKLITSYSDFVKKMTYIMEQLGTNVEDYDIIRADFCFNSSDVSSYENYQKLHRLLISCLAKAYKFRNCYVSCDLWDWKRLSIAIKKNDCEAENYNKARQSEGKDESANRLELRSKRMSNTTIEYQFMSKWFERLDKASRCFENVQKEYNDHLEALYKADLRKNKKDRDYSSLTNFLVQYRECIYTRKQMINLLSRFEEVKNPEKKANNFKETHNIEYFTLKDLNYIIEILKKKTYEYFNS